MPILCVANLRSTSASRLSCRFVSRSIRSHEFDLVVSLVRGSIQFVSATGRLQADMCFVALAHLFKGGGVEVCSFSQFPLISQFPAVYRNLSQFFRHCSCFSILLACWCSWLSLFLARTRIIWSAAVVQNLCFINKRRLCSRILRVSSCTCDARGPFCTTQKKNRQPLIRKCCSRTVKVGRLCHRNFPQFSRNSPAVVRTFPAIHGNWIGRSMTAMPPPPPRSLHLSQNHSTCSYCHTRCLIFNPYLQY